MAFFLTPRFAPTYQCGPSSCQPSRPVYRQVSHQPFPSFVPFLSQVDELLSELNREGRRAAHQRQQRKRAFRARFDVKENKEGYTVEGEVPGFEQENIEIQVTDEHTVSIKGNTQPESETQAQKPGQEQPGTATEPEADKMDGVTLNEAEGPGTATPAGSDTGSVKSYQATVEDDFEDLGAETSSTISAESNPSTSNKGKEKAVEEPSTQTEQQPQQEPQEAEPENRTHISERTHGSFERTFRFPVRIDSANVRASLKNGILAINVPKAPVPEVRQILIQ
ncbi:HSP20-like chaperone [Zopfia rhizophila CBS 207.26]|uniref:HSP20-like chaperone n=1 Tax=Zopfia rhizophila CBS 207.26 TaxID=1314779 RepID=A0A6A6DY36_9PEZI|nr:HSP20-like chaperone [Zopfia rhizophila CBS 207.26]